VQQTFCGSREGDVADYSALLAQMESVGAGSDGLLFLPYLAGERAPVWDAKSCGVYFGLGARHSRLHLMRAAIEGVCFALADVLKMLESGGAAINILRVSGGFTASSVWLQMIADVTGKRVEQLQWGDASALGAAYLALEVDGITVRPPEPVAIFYPREQEGAVYARSYAIYRTLYPALQKSMHEHHKLNT
jgi:gluconokinase